MEVESTDSTIHVAPAVRASHEGADAKTAEHHADEDETAVEWARAVPAPLSSQPTAREFEAHLSGAHTAQSMV